MKKITEEQKGTMAKIIILASAISVVLGFIIPDPVLGSFPLGTWISFLGYIFSLACVHDHGSNRLGAIAFWASFIAMAITILLGTKM